MISEPILTLTIAREKDVVAARQCARQVAELLGFHSQDQTRIATAVSEIARNAHDYGGGGSVEFFLTGRTAPQTLEVRVRDHGPGIENVNRILRGEHRSATGMGVGLRGAQRLMDRFSIDSELGRGTTITLSKVLPAATAVLGAAELQRIADRLARSGDEDPLHELRRQNQELMVSLDLVRSQQEKLNELRQQAEAATEAKAEFLASMSHEFRTPLNAIIGFTERLTGEDLTPDQRRYVGRIHAAGSMLLKLVDDVLDFSQIEAGRIELDPQPFSLEGLVEGAVSIISGAADEKGLPVHLWLSPDLPGVLLGDEPRLRQVLLNLLSNAVKFTHKGHIRLAVDHEGRSDDGEIVRFSVTDTGIGISPARREQLFRRFTQGDPAIHREFGGTGLGLAISKSLVELMRGEIGLTSEHGSGSTFWFVVTLPQASLEDVQGAEERTPEFTKSARILVAEDLETNQELVRWTLERAGHHVDIVTNGADAVAAIEARHYDLVLMDIRMPRVDGLTATRTIRRMDAPARGIPIVAMTGHVLPHHVEALRQAGMDDYISKPMKQIDLLKKVSAVLTGAGVSHDTATAEPVPDAGFDRRTFEELGRLLDSDRLSAWIGRLVQQLETTFDTENPVSVSRERLGGMAHDIVSQAGTLGFLELSQRCKALEEHCLGGGDISRAYGEARRAAQEARGVLTSLMPSRSESRKDDQPPNS